MITFSRKDLIKSQKSKLDRIYKDVNFFVWLGWVLTTIISVVVMYFFSIMIGVWLEALVMLACALYYLTMSFVRERMNIGYYQTAKEIQIDIIETGFAIKEITKEDKFEYVLTYDQIFKVVEYKGYFSISLTNEGMITLPDCPQAEELKEELKRNVKNRYFVLKD